MLIDIGTFRIAHGKLPCLHTFTRLIMIEDINSQWLLDGIYPADNTLLHMKAEKIFEV